jgi:hypothetical protein
MKVLLRTIAVALFDTVQTIEAAKSARLADHPERP